MASLHGTSQSVGVGATFLTAFAHSVSLPHILVFSEYFRFFSLLFVMVT